MEYASGPWRRILQTIILAVACLGLVSCGHPEGFYPVRGKVYFNGEPAKGAEVIFHPKSDHTASALHPMGTVNENGDYTLSCYGRGEGAPPGDYYVFVRWLESAIPQGNKKFKKRNKPIPGDVFKGRYQNHDKPMFFAEVKPEDNEIAPFELKSDE